MDHLIRRGHAGDVERLKPLWLALRNHHETLPAMPPVRSLEESWERRKGQYLDWLEKDQYTLLVAESYGEPIGYAMISIGDGPATWELGDLTAEIETLSVLEDERGLGVGRALMEAAGNVAREAGARSVAVGVAHTNVDAIRFYERAGFEPFYVLMVRR